MIKDILKFFHYLLVGIICEFRKIGIWTFPKGIRLLSGRFFQNLATSVAGKLARTVKNKKYTQNKSELMKNPFLRFHANYSLTHVDLNTPCTRSLAVDLASVTQLSDKRILCLGSRNLDEIFQLQLVGARLENITAVDLYSEFTEIIAMDFQDLKFEDGSFDVIFWAGSYAYASDPMLALSEAFRVLRSPGLFALGDTYIGEATKSSYHANQSHYLKDNSELDSALSELPEGTTLTKGLSGLEEIQERVKSFGVEKIVLSRDYVTTPHYNLIAMINK